GNVKLTDFGIARLRHTAQGTLAEEQTIAGTPHFMSPEQIRGDEVDGRSDLYSLGVVLYWLLSGDTPFRADNVHELLRKILTEPLPPPKPLDPATPQALLDVVRTLLDRDPTERYQTGAELLEDLQRIDDALAEQERNWQGRRFISLRLSWTAIMSVLVAVTVSAGLGWVYHRQNEAMTRLAYDYGLALTETLALESAEDLLLEDRIALQALVDEMARKRDIAHVSISDGEGRAYFLFDTPVLYQNHELGRLRLSMSTAALQAANRATMTALIAVLLATLATVLVGVYMLSRRLVVPIEILRRALGQITQGRFDKRIRMRRNDEFERLFSAYNAMADSLEARMFSAHSHKRNAAAPNVPPAPATRLVDAPPPRTRHHGKPRSPSG
ncbi:MAG TPA: HAMP domain-containing protein, partial [Pseudothauera hydrothermalis]|nr:HAMP domain-containing protein [Pseudothauera hydrothermalis]